MAIMVCLTDIAPADHTCQSLHPRNANRCGPCPHWATPLPLQRLQRTLTTSHQQQLILRCVADLLVPLAAKMSEEPFRLVIMDSVAANLRVDFTGRGVSHTSECAAVLDTILVILETP